jgi:hypothetical protein
MTKTLEPYLSQKGRAKVIFDTCGPEDCEIDVDTLREENRKYAIRALRDESTGSQSTGWKRGFLNKGLKKSYGSEPVVVRGSADAALEETFEIGSDPGFRHPRKLPSGGVWSLLGSQRRGREGKVVE